MGAAALSRKPFDVQPFRVREATPVLNSSFTVTVAPYSLTAVRVR
jgi:hypothetical protein